MPHNDFLLPDDLGWECNDEVSRLIDAWATNLDRDGQFTPGVPVLWSVAKAELMDDIYDIIRKYQIKGITRRS